MKIGLSNFPTDYSISATILGRAAEERGFESVWAAEHTHIPASRRTPYALGGDLPSIYWESYEPFTFLAQVAAATNQLAIGTAICLVPEHHPITLAKRVASLDSLSGGRFLFGIGAGWNAEELQNHGIAFPDRWKVLREHVLAMKQCWTKKDAEFHGDFVDFDPVWVGPKPVSNPHPPILIGAGSKWALERVIEYAEGWMPLLTPDLDEQLAQLNSLCEQRGRNREEIDVSVFLAHERPHGRQGRNRKEIEVSVPEMVGSKDALAELHAKGVNRVIVSLPTVAEKEALNVMDSYAEMLGWAAQLS